MARKTQNRMDLRKQAEAAGEVDPEDGDDLELDDDGDADLDADLDLDIDDDSGDEAPKRKKRVVKKKATTARPKRVKAKAIVRKRMFWVVFSTAMKEEARFSYAERELAEQKVEALKLKNKKEYFIQPVKEPIADAAPSKADKAEKAAP